MEASSEGDQAPEGVVATWMDGSWILFEEIFILEDRSSALVKALCYKSEGRWFDPSWCHWNFSLT